MNAIKTTPAKFQEGDAVIWTDPDEGFGTGLYLVTKVINENGINSHYMLSDGSSEIEAYEHEMHD